MPTPKPAPKDPAEDPSRATEPPGFVPAIILRNKGVPITLYRLENGALPEIDADDEDAVQPTRKVFLRFNANHVADIEDAFDGIVARVPIIRREAKMGPDQKPLVGPAGPVYEETVEGYEDRVFYGLEAFQQALEAKTAGTLRKVLSIAFAKEETEMGLSMDPSQMVHYQNAVGVAWSIAQGVDPTDAAKVLQRANAAVATQLASLASQLDKTMDKAEESTTVSPGATG